MEASERFATVSFIEEFLAESAATLNPLRGLFYPVVSREVPIGRPLAELAIITAAGRTGLGAANALGQYLFEE
jgi:hypothetical protein